MINLPRLKTGDRLVTLTGERVDLFGFQTLFPNVARGDDRDKLLWQVIAEARDEQASPSALLKDAELKRELSARLDLGPEASPVVSEALVGRFFNRKKGVRVLLPTHASLPLNYKHTSKTGTPSRYRLYNGGLVPFLLWNGHGVARTPLIRLLDVVENEGEFTALDRKFLDIARDGSAFPDLKASAESLIVRYEEDLRADFDRFGGPFCQPSLDRFARDLETVLDTDLPRPDKIHWLTLLLSLHVGIRLYRIAVVKGFELDRAVAAAACMDPPAEAVVDDHCCSGDGSGRLEKCALAGRIRFRTGTGRYRPIRQRDGARTSWMDVDHRRLLDMPATLVTRTLASAAWEALGGGERAARMDVDALARALKADSDLRVSHGAACAAIAVIHHSQWRQGATFEELLDVSRTSERRPGLHALRNEVRHMRRGDLRHQGRDIVNQLLLDVNVGSPGSLLSRNGSLTFFEVDEEMLLLLVRLTCRDAQVPFTEFVEGLRAYGLEPQDDSELAALADALERLGLLARYSDSGEASFVHFN
ncbi:DNA phosphorothioation-dependent restriction protein DptG [Cellulosimicrobium sp. SJTW-1]|uniref:DNA phosphorothioation-dependent restriction protein DptG n=1 Tax=Cellulosimicrobium sp. SJTW-1 TaxID=3078082 RepID=UPI0039ECFC62